MATGWFSPKLASIGWFRNLSPQAWFDERFLGAATGGPPSASPWLWLDDKDVLMVRTNVAGQVIGAQMISAADGSAFTGAVTCYVTIDGGTQAVGSVGAGACAHEGNGYHTYAPAQAETNGVRLAYTFVGTGAVPRTVQVTGVSFNPADATALGLSRLDVAISSRSSHAAADVWSVATRLLTAGTNIALAKGTGVTGFTDLDAAGVRTAVGLASANLDTQLSAIDTVVDAVLVDTGTTLQAEVDDIQTRLPAALVSGRMDASVGAMAANVLTATAINADAITAAKVAADVTTEIQTGLATAANLATVAGYLDTEIAAILADTNELQTDWANGGRLDLILDARASQTSVDDLPTNAELATSQAAADDATLAAIAALPVPLDAAATRAAVGLASANLDTQFAALPTAVETADEVATRSLTVGTNNDKTGYAIGSGGISSAAFAAGAIDASALNASAVDEILDEAIGDGTVTLRQAMKLMVAVLGGKVTGAGTSSITFRNTADTTDVVVSAIDGVGNRTGVTLTL